MIPVVGIGNYLKYFCFGICMFDYHLLPCKPDTVSLIPFGKTLPVFPNQKRCIYVSTVLKIDGDIPEEMKVLYDEIVANPEKKPSIKAVLLDKKCFQFLRKLNGETRKPETVAQAINAALEKFEIDEKNVLPPARIPNHGKYRRRLRRM